MVPFVELANHGHSCCYDTGEGVWLKGTPRDEATACYSATDSYGLFRGWGFACAAPRAYSVEMEISVARRRLVVGRHAGDAVGGAQSPVPAISLEGDIVRLEFVELANRDDPQRCGAIFGRVLRAAGFADPGIAMAFAALQDANRRHFVSLLGALDGIEGAMAENLRRMAGLQLDSLDMCLGPETDCPASADRHHFP